MFVQITFFSWNYSKRNGRKEVQLLLNFFKQEIFEDDKLDTKIKMEDVLEEISNFEDISIIIKNNNFTLKEGKINLKNIPTKDRIFMYRYYRYYVYNGVIYDNKNRAIQITIIKNLKENIEFVLDIFFILTGVFILLNLMVLILYKYFYKNMISQIKKIE
jgi:ABC-type antimicrobial peptide transport system permease subunit